MNLFRIVWTKGDQAISFMAKKN